MPVCLVPVFGTAPLTVDFYVGLSNTLGSILDEWIFGNAWKCSYQPNPSCSTSISIRGRTSASLD